MKTKPLFAVGVLLLAAAVYLFCGSSNTRTYTKSRVQELEKQVSELEPETLELQMNLARWYNLNLTSRHPEENFKASYPAILDLSGHAMGTVEIPDIEIQVPIYHGVEQSAAQIGFGHLPDSAFPIGGVGNHSVLIGNMEKDLLPVFGFLSIGDTFRIRILKEVLTYSVVYTSVVHPEELEDFPVDPSLDLCTLVVSTPATEKTYCFVIQGKRTSDAE